jgi:hypothetical protein
VQPELAREHFISIVVTEWLLNEERQLLKLTPFEASARWPSSYSTEAIILRIMHSSAHGFSAENLMVLVKPLTSKNFDSKVSSYYTPSVYLPTQDSFQKTKRSLK